MPKRKGQASSAALDNQLAELLRANAEIHALLEKQAAAGLSELHAPIERFGNMLARPTFIVAALVCFLGWILLNLDLKFTTHKPWDEPPFYWLQGLIGLLSLIFTATVLASQARQAQLAEQRAQLQLQIILLTEQRSAKLIDLLEELRRDLPNVHNRIDPEAEALRQVNEPTAILEALSEVQQGLEEGIQKTEDIKADIRDNLSDAP